MVHWDKCTYDEENAAFSPSRTQEVKILYICPDVIME
jgi:hypothetical protein